jgi:excisionase family DNA binding protein
MQVVVKQSESRIYDRDRYFHKKTAAIKQGGKAMTEKSVLSVQELARQMGISLPKAYELVKEPGFPTIRIGTRILIPTEGFRDWLRQKSGSEA